MSAPPGTSVPTGMSCLSLESYCQRPQDPFFTSSRPVTLLDSESGNWNDDHGINRPLTHSDSVNPVCISYGSFKIITWDHLRRAIDIVWVQSLRVLKASSSRRLQTGFKRSPSSTIATMNFKLTTSVFLALGLALLTQASPAAYPRCKDSPSCC